MMETRPSRIESYCSWKPYDDLGYKRENIRWSLNYVTKEVILFDQLMSGRRDFHVQGTIRYSKCTALINKT